MVNATDISDHFFYLNKDPRTEGWFLMDSPAKVATLLAAYLLFVTKIGPAWMKNRKAYQLKEFMMVYNVLQIICCTTLVVFSFIPLTQFAPTCARLSFSEEMKILPILSYCFFVLKVIDLLDTVIFVLRKKDQQISFLHLFHHVYAITLGYMNTRYLAGTQIPLLTFWNSAVHMVMYYYYMRVALDNKPIWWKKYLTSFQLFQLGIMLTCMIPTLLRPSCQFPKLPVFYIMLVPTSVLVSEFGKFYNKSYTKPTDKDISSHGIAEAKKIE